MKLEAMKETKLDKKQPCNCGCKGDKSQFAANIPASPAFIDKVEEGTKLLLQGAKAVKLNGRKPYAQLYLFPKVGRLLMSPGWSASLVPLRRHLGPSTKLA